MESEALYKICPECGTDYRPMATRCSDCDVELVHRESLAAAIAEREHFPEASELDCIRVAPIEWVQGLSGALQQRGVGHRVEPATAADAPDGQRPDLFGEAQLYGLFVLADDAPLARELDDAIAARIMPEEAPELAEGEEECCPACGSALAAHATECGDCGLSFA
ncbi:MAG: hypothetical protein ACQGVK_12000 [Myxococcota bacterium]